MSFLLIDYWPIDIAGGGSQGDWSNVKRSEMIPILFIEMFMHLMSSDNYTVIDITVIQGIRTSCFWIDTIKHYSVNELLDEFSICV